MRTDETTSSGISANARRVAKHAAKRKALGQERLSIWVDNEDAALIRRWIRMKNEASDRLGDIARRGELPPLAQLQGSPAQVKWASEIRTSRIGTLLDDEFNRKSKPFYEFTGETDPNIPGLLRLLWVMTTESRAKWWIETRHLSFGQFKEAIRRRDEQPAFRPAPDSDAVRTIDEDLLRPDRVRGSLAEISTDGRLVCVAFEGFTETGNQITRACKLRWEAPYWQRECDEDAAALNCAVEVGVLLLSSGHPLRVLDEDLRRRITQADYEPEPKRRIDLAVSEKYGTKFRLQWEPSDAKDCARALSSFSSVKLFRNGGGAFVPLSQFEVVEDLADTAGFEIGDDAQAAIEAERMKYRQAIEVRPRAKRPNAPAVNSLPATRARTSVGIDVDLIDD